jgi:hypothetical protein
MGDRKAALFLRHHLLPLWKPQEESARLDDIMANGSETRGYRLLCLLLILKSVIMKVCLFV